MSEKKSEHKPAAKKKNPLVILLIVVAVIVVLSFLAMTAGSIFFASKFNEALKKGGVQYTTDGDSFTFKETNGDSSVSVGQNAQLPADFPQDFPLIQGAKPVSVVTTKEGYAVTFTVMGMSGSEVSGWYKSELPGKGWEVKESPGFGVLEFENSALEGTLIVVDDKDDAAGFTVNLKRR